MEHPPWRVWTADQGGFEGEMESLYGADFAGLLRRPPDSALLAEGSPITVYAGRRLVLPSPEFEILSK